MNFNICSLNMDLVIDGWKKPIQIRGKDLSSLQCLDLRGGHSMEKKLELPIDVSSMAHTLLLPLSITCLPGGKETITVDFPNTVVVKRNGKTINATIESASFSFVDLTPSWRAVHIVASGLSAQCQ